MAPIAWYFAGSAKKSLISRSSATASSAPATSAKVFVGVSLVFNLARERPNENTLPPCPPPINNINKKIIKKIGRMLSSNEIKNDCVGTSTFHLLAGGLLVNNSIINGSWPTTYEASSRCAPSTNSPDFKTTRIF
ncbi:unannotated protein [freshwater metagenome]|uniref:Unannotated protein n=1 Tax=freshwater metagenome TaxID=449393 RepID=A0A6J7BTR9_9ZZZZ